MRKLLLLLMFCKAAQANTDYRDLKAYAHILFAALKHASEEHPEYDTDAMRLYLTGDATKPIFEQATLSCFDEYQVIRACFQVSVGSDVAQIPIIQHALHDELASILYWRRVRRYSIYGGLGTTGLLGIYSIYFFVWYSRHYKHTLGGLYTA
jgi:hypothetical protein